MAVKVVTDAADRITGIVPDVSYTVAVEVDGVGPEAGGNELIAHAENI
jgi:hypothetical protein